MDVKCLGCGHRWDDHYSDGCDTPLTEPVGRSPYCPCDATPAERIKELEADSRMAAARARTYLKLGLSGIWTRMDWPAALAHVLVALDGSTCVIDELERAKDRS